MPMLEDAILLALQAHRGQVDKAGKPYVLHVLRVMLGLESDQEKMVGVLHDVLEDTAYTLNRVREMGYPEEVLRALDCLTKREGEPYEQFIKRVKANPIARRVNPVPRTYVGGFEALPFGEVQNIHPEREGSCREQGSLGVHPRAYIRGVLWYGVKIADLKDNLDIKRLPVLTQDDLERIRKYRRALSQLEKNS